MPQKVNPQGYQWLAVIALETRKKMFYSLKHDPQPRNKTSLLKTKIFLSNSLAFHSQIRTKSQMAEVRHHRPIPHTLPTRRLLLPSVLSSSSTCHSLLPSVVSSSLLIRTLSMWVAVLVLFFFLVDFTCMTNLSSSPNLSLNTLITS